MAKLGKMKGESEFGGAIYVDKDDELVLVQGRAVDFVNCDVVVTDTQVVIYPASFKNEPFSLAKALSGKNQTPRKHEHERFIIKHEAIVIPREKIDQTID